MGILKSNINGHIKESPIVVKICSHPDLLTDNFIELFIHAILSIYQHRRLNNKDAKLVTPFILTSYLPQTREFITLLEPIDGDLKGLLKSSDSDMNMEIAKEAIFYQSCGLIPLQKDLRFIHGDNHPGNVFYKNIDGKRKYFFADFGFTNITVNGNLLCAGCINAYERDATAHYFSPRRDLIQLTYNCFIYEFLISNISEFRIKLLQENMF